MLLSTRTSSVVRRGSIPSRARSLAVMVFVSLASVSRASAQESTREVGIGTRVRILAPDLRAERYVGRIDSLDVQSLTIDTAGARTRLGLDTGPVMVDQYRRVTIRRTAIKEIQISGGRTTRGATMKGLVLGAVGGGVLWGFGNMPEINPQTSDFVKNFPPGAVIGGVVGALVGFALGGERWYPAFLPK